MLTRKRMIDTVQEAGNFGPYDEFPVLPAGIDPQLHLSRNDRPQPFFLICEKDTVLVQMSGTATLNLNHPCVRSYYLCPGDFVYVPAGTPHQLVPDDVSVNYRYKAEHAGLEGVAWYCQKCGSDLRRTVWDTAVELPQEGYQRAITEFNAQKKLRTCRKCGSEHPEINLAGFRWAEIATQLRKAGPPISQLQPAETASEH